MSRPKPRDGSRRRDASPTGRRANTRPARQLVPCLEAPAPGAFRDPPPLPLRLARLLPGDAERHQPCGCGPYDPYTAHAEEWRACGCVISHLYLG